MGFDPIPYPLVNGNRYSWSSVILKVAGQTITGVKSINYSQELKPGAVFGTHAQKIGRTRGEGLNPEVSVELYKEEFDSLLQLLGNGFYEEEFEIVSQYDEGLKVVTDYIRQCRITKLDDSHQQSGDALTVKIDIDAMYIAFSGKAPLKNMLNGII